MVGFILAATVGIFELTLPAVTGWAYEALITELVSAVVLAVLVRLAWKTARWADGSAPNEQVARGMAGNA